jgi:hypothetical protein
VVIDFVQSSRCGYCLRRFSSRIFFVVEPLALQIAHFYIVAVNQSQLAYTRPSEPFGLEAS